MVVAADAVDMDPEALQRVERLFHDQIARGEHPGAALAVYRYGRPVLDLWGGVADVETGRPVREDTLWVLFSSTKPLASVSVLKLIERGQAALDDPVARYWPEFARNGKERVTIRHILTHRGGFPLTPEGLHWSTWRDWDAVVRAMEEVTPRWEPGTVSAYHLLNHGWVCGELVRRIDGRPFPQFLREEITEPLGMHDTYVGLPPELEPRVAKLHPMEDVPEQEQGTVRTFNRPEVHQAVVPAGCGIATARDMARFYAALVNGGELDGARILERATIEQATQVEIDGDTDAVLSTSGLATTVRRGLGFNLGGVHPFSSRMGMGSTARTFGHGGAGTSICWADWDLGVAFAFIPNGFRGRETLARRCLELSDGVREACR
ncbi:MAG TPA: serine hydrolase domain-containing protein [Dehalococcoidia bacterium]